MTPLNTIIDPIEHAENYWNARANNLLPAKEKDLFKTAMSAVSRSYHKALLQMTLNLDEKIKTKLGEEARVALMCFGETLFTSIEKYKAQQQKNEKKMEDFESRLEKLSNIDLFKPLESSSSYLEGLSKVVESIAKSELKRFPKDMQEDIIMSK